MKRSALTCIGLLSGLVATAAMGQAQPSSAPSDASLPEVTVTASRVLTHKELGHAVAGFVASHSTPGNRIAQVGRWFDVVCPGVTGLQEPARDFVTHEMIDIARAAGAPTRAAGKKCNVNVEVVFTREPQALLDHIAKSYRLLLGYFPRSQAADYTKFTGPVEGWYETATRSNNTRPGSVSGQISPQAQLDTEQTAMGWQPSGSGESLLGFALASEFVHVLIIADSTKVDHYPLRAVADYVGLLALTRISQSQGCAPLASITDLLAAGCPPPGPDSLTAADQAYLKGLYAADLYRNLNLERGDMHEQMMRQLETK